MRTQEEIQRAHDLLHSVIRDDINIGQTAEIKNHAAITCLSLCWVLGCDAGGMFAGNIAAIEEAIKAAGCRISEAPVPMIDAEFQTWRESR